MFLNSVKSYVKQFNTKSVYVTWDKKLLWPSTNFRIEAVKEYKGHRDKEKAKDVFANEEDLVIMLQCLGIKNMYPRIMEADDIMAWLCEKLEGPNIVVTADQDLLQLVSEKTCFYNSLKKKVVDLKNFEEEVGVKAVGAYLYYKALRGDSSDNITGINGYGKKKAKVLAEKMFDENDITPAELNKDQLVKLLKNIKVMNLKKGYTHAGPEEAESYEEQFNELIDIDVNLERFREYCEKFEFGQFLKKFDEWENLFKESRLFSLLNSLSTG